MTEVERAALPIGFMDSGVGGIAVLRSAIEALPYEDFIFYGDIGNAPYGNGKSNELIAQLVIDAAEVLHKRGIKALVVACNTATSAAIEVLRDKYADMPVLGMEPAVKPAVEALPGTKIGVMATPAALTMERFQRRLGQFGEVAELISLPCGGLSRLIETDGPQSPAVEEYLRDLFAPYPRGSLAGIVIGCTHYLFIEGVVARLTGAQLFDGTDGTVRHLARRLDECGIRSRGEGRGSVTLAATQGSEDQLPLFHRFLNMNKG